MTISSTRKQCLQDAPEAFLDVTLDRDLRQFIRLNPEPLNLRILKDPLTISSFYINTPAPAPDFFLVPGFDDKFSNLLVIKACLYFNLG